MPPALLARLVIVAPVGDPVQHPPEFTRSASPPADLISARLFKTLRSVAMRSYSHLSEDERDRIGVLRAAGRSMGAIARAPVGRKPPSPGSCGGTHSLWAGIRRFTPPEPINCAGGVKRSSNERPPYVCCGGPARGGMDARTDLRLVEIWE